MNEAKYIARIVALESFAARRPGLYRFRVALLASLGYLYLFSVVLLLLASVAAMIAYGRINFLVIKAIWIPLVLIGLVLRSLWVTIPVPDGKELKREQAPALFDLIHEVSQALSGPTVNHVLLNDEFNASIVQIPRFGMFGWFSNYLVLGLPLMRGLSPAEFRAVLAHEFGHLSHKHGRFAGWIYRVRQSWVQILTSVHQERSYASFLFEPFLKWYAPFLGAYSFVLARAQEREADLYAVDLAGKDVAALALIRLNTKQRGMREDFWPTFFRGAKEQPRAPKDTFTQMLSGVEHQIGPAKAQRWFLEALRVPTGYDDTHPALGDRLAAIGFQKDGSELTALVEAVVNADEVTESAASRYLRELPDDFEPSMNRLWRERIGQLWSKRHAEINDAAKRIAKLEELLKTRPLTIDEQWERARAIADAEDAKAAVPALRALLSESPDHIGANFGLGSTLLEQGNAEGIEYLKKVVDTSAEVASEVCQLISGFYFAQGDHAQAEKYREHAEGHHRIAAQLRQQALTFSIKDHFVPHDLDAGRIAEMQTQLWKVRGLGAAYLVRKLIEGEAQVLYVFAVTAEFIWREGRSVKNLDALFNELSGAVTLPSPVVLLALEGENAYLLPEISRVAGAQIFPVKGQ